MRKISIHTKLLAMCILLVLLSTVSISIAYYLLTKQDAHRESQQRIRIAFDIILDDIKNRLHTSTTRLNEFFEEDSTLRGVTYFYNEDPGQIRSVDFVSAQLTKVADTLKNFGQLVTTHRLAVYGLDQRLLAVYQQDADQETVGIYWTLPNGTDSYLPLDDPDQLFEIRFGNVPREETPLPSGVDSHFSGEIPDTVRAGFFHDEQQLGIQVIAPIYRGENKTGVLVSETFYTQDNVERFASLSKTQVNLFTTDQFSVGTFPSQTALKQELLEEHVTCQELSTQQGMLSVAEATVEDHDYYQGACSLQNFRDETIGAIVVMLSQNIEQQAISKMLILVLTISGIVIIVALGLSIMFSRRTIRAIQNIVDVIVTAAEGDLRKTAFARTQDEIGMLAQKLNQMIAQLRTISGQVQEASHAIHGTADTVSQQMETLVKHMREQLDSVDEATGSLEQVKQFIDTVTQNTGDLLAAASQILASMQETRASIEEVTTSTGHLTDELQRILVSTEKSNETMKTISENTTQLMDIARQTETEIHHIDDSLNDIFVNADQTQQLADETKDAALDGQDSVEASLQGMTELKTTVSQAAQIIQEVNTWGEQVSSILGMVDDITEQTSLLALNASIISAQAGVHGRGFAVVADEIKNLAVRTKSSTQEIGALIQQLQQKTGKGVRNISDGLTKAEQGMDLVQAVQEVLQRILHSATRTSSRAVETTQLIQKTADSGKIISSSMNKVTEMVTHISSAIQRQEEDMKKVLSAVENISGMSEQVNRASIEQKKAVEQVALSMSHVTEQFNDISNQTTVLQDHSDQIVAAMHTVTSTTKQILNNTTAISGDSVNNLSKQSTLLQKIVNVFKI